MVKNKLFSIRLWLCSFQFNFFFTILVTSSNSNISFSKSKVILDFVIGVEEFVVRFSLGSCTYVNPFLIHIYPYQSILIHISILFNPYSVEMVIVTGGKRHYPAMGRLAKFMQDCGGDHLTNIFPKVGRIFVVLLTEMIWFLSQVT